MSILDSNNIEIGTTGVIFGKVLSGGSDTGTADTTYRLLGYLAEELGISKEDVNEIIVNAHPSPTSVKQFTTIGNHVITANLCSEIMLHTGADHHGF
jgi:hypothetical protein